MPTRIQSVLRSREGCFTAYARRGDEGPPRGRRTLTGREASQEDYRKQIISVEILLANSLDTLPRSNVSGTELSRGIVSANGRSVASSRFARDFLRKLCRCRHRRPRNVRVSLYDTVFQFRSIRSATKSADSSHVSRSYRSCNETNSVHF